MRRLEVDKDWEIAGQYAYAQIKNEKAQRHFLALQAKTLGYGGISAISRTYNVSRQRIRDGIKEIETEGLFVEGRQRKEGAGRPSIDCRFTKHMQKQLEDPEYVYIINAAEKSDHVGDNSSAADSLNNTEKQSDNKPVSEEVSPKEATTKKTDAEANKKGSRRSLDIAGIIKKHSEHLKLNPNCIILPDNPFSIDSWVNQIIEEQFAAVYGDAASPHLYVNLTVNEIRERLAARTHFDMSQTSMWNKMREMGYSLHKNVKYEQVGTPHEQRDEQFLYIQANIDDFLETGDPIFSIDAKAAIKLGCFLMNGRVWCPQYQPPYVLDHDFAFLFRQIYLNGSDIIPLHFMDKRAIVKPFGVYDYGHNLAHVTLGISKDTSEFARDSVLNGWEVFKALYPSPKRILILSDGGGSNRSSGILWKQEVFKIARTIELPVTVCHYPPGCSKYDPIEHHVFGPISKNCSGSPLLDIERVKSFVESTTTKKGLKVSCEINTNEYLTQEDKKKAGIHIMTQSEFDKNVKISYPNKSGDLAFWNYVIFPD